MTPEQDLPLDRRAAAAAVGLRAAVAERPVPPFDPDLVRIPVDAPPAVGRRRLALAGVAAAVLLVVGALALAGGGGGDGADGGDERGPAAEAGATGPVRYLPDAVPAGYAVAHVSEPGGGEGDGGGDPGTGPRPLVLYGTDPAAPELGLIVGPAGGPSLDDEDLTGTQLERVEIGGRTAVRPVDAVSGAPWLTVQIGDRQVQVLAADPATLEPIAASVQLAGDRPALVPSETPGDWRHLGDVEVPGGFGVDLAVEGGIGTYHAQVSYARGEGDQLSVRASAGGALNVAVNRLLGDASEAVTVQGHDAVLVRLDPDTDAARTRWYVEWEERPGVVVRVHAGGLGRDEALAVAESVRPATADEWRDLVRQSLKVVSPADGDMTLVGEGSFPGGEPWALFASDPAQGPVRPRLQTTFAQSGSESDVSTSGAPTGGSPEDAVFRPGAVAETRGDQSWAYGLVRDDVATVEVVDGDGMVVATVEVVRAGGLAGWVTELPAAAAGPGGELVARAADGAELGRDGTLL